MDWNSNYFVEIFKVKKQFTKFINYYFLDLSTFLVLLACEFKLNFITNSSC